MIMMKMQLEKVFREMLGKTERPEFPGEKKKKKDNGFHYLFIVGHERRAMTTENGHGNFRLR